MTSSHYQGFLQCLHSRYTDATIYDTLLGTVASLGTTKLNAIGVWTSCDMSSQRKHRRGSVLGPNTLQQLIDAEDLQSFSTAASCLPKQPEQLAAELLRPSLHRGLALAWANGLKLLITHFSGSLLDAPSDVLEPINFLSTHMLVWLVSSKNAQDAISGTSSADISTAATQAELANRVATAGQLTKAGKARLLVRDAYKGK